MYKHFAYILTLLFIPGIVDCIYAETDTQRDLQLQKIEKETNTVNRSNKQQITDNHYTRIIKAHPDYKQIVYNSNLAIYIFSLPITERDQAKNIVLEGTSSEIISLLYSYKNFDIPKIDKDPMDLASKQTFMKTSKEVGMSNKNAIIDFVNEYIKQNKEIERQKNVHFKKIAEVYPDYEKIAFSTDFNNYIKNMPEVQSKAAKRVFESGSAEEIITLISDYKRRSNSDLDYEKDKP